MKKAFFIYSTFPNIKIARNIAKKLVEKNLVSCVNIFKVESHYKWKGKIENSKEFVLICKTDSKRVNNAIMEIEREHPYEIPFIGKIPLEINKKYFDWMISEK
ncbi:MAG: divalent-cation tolerance protein CutA [Candidatus Aenigmatarchaeota archaeon]